MKPWKTLSRKIILDHNKFLTVEEHVIQLSNGQIVPNWSWIITPDFINTVVVTEEGDFLCFRQTKYAVEGTSLAIVGGYLEPGETPLNAAKRELLEETGYKAPHWTSLGRYSVDGNRGAGVAHFFLAQNARRVADINADDLEEQELLFLTRAEVETALANNAFKVLPWATALALALLHKT